jgi:branched-subunit amino acid transport protein
VTAWITFAVAGLGTYLSRSLFILLVGDRVLPPKAERALRNIGPAVLAALTVSLLTTEGVVAFATSVPEVSAVAVGTIVGVWRRSFMASFAAAITVWAVLSLIL